MGNKKRNTKFYVLIVLLLITIGFALLSATLKIDGLINIDKNTWNIHFENVSVSQGSVTATTAPTSDNTTTKEMTYAVLLDAPGDYYEFTVDIANTGSVDGMISLVENKVYEVDGVTEKEIPSYLRSTITYIDGLEIKNKQLLPHGTSEKIKVRVEFRTDISESDLPTEAEDTIFKFVGNFTQATDEAIPIRLDFSTASWDKITTAYENNPTSLQQSMESGTTKEVQLDLDNDGTAETTAHLRIANLSTPSECAQPGFSRSACGLVIEFVELINSYRMNPYVSGDTTTPGVNNNGGWEHSDMRNYLNSTFYNALPQELKSRIVDTPVVSGHGPYESDNFYTIDKLYLLGAKEVWGSNPGYDTAADLTRQLDYYHNIGVTTSNYGGAIKYELNRHREQDWWLRSVYSSNQYGFYMVYVNGGWYLSNTTNSNDYHCVSPAFRIA